MLDKRDAVGNKVAATFSRGETRDFVDLDAIRRSGLWTDAQLLDLARERDAGFSAEYLRDQLNRASKFSDDRWIRSSVEPSDLANFRQRLAQLIDSPLLASPSAQPADLARRPAGAPGSHGGEFTEKQQSAPEIGLPPSTE